MASQLPFVPQGKSFLVAANSTAPSGVAITTTGDVRTNTVRLHNADANQIVWWGYGTTAADAKANAVIPGATGNNSMGLPPNAVEVVRLNIAAASNQQLFVSGITASATQANLIVTPGDGI